MTHDLTGHSTRQLDADLRRLEAVRTVVDLMLTSITNAAANADTTAGEETLSALETVLVDQQKPALDVAILAIQEELATRDGREQAEHERLETARVRA